MLRHTTKMKLIKPLNKAELKSKNIHERYDFQKSIVNS